MAVGLTVQGAYHNFRDILDAKFFSIPTFLVVIGSFIFVIAFFGCCGAYKENYCMTLTVRAAICVRMLIVCCLSSLYVIAFFFCSSRACCYLQFSVLLILIFILELAAGISGYVLRNDTRELVSNALNSSMKSYGGENAGDITLVWDEIQVDVSI